MSWTDIFPVLTDEQLDQYQAEKTQAEVDILEEWFGVSEVYNARSGKHLVTTSLFWKRLWLSEGDLPKITRELMQNAGELGLVSRYDPWSHYVQPLLEGAAALGKTRPDIVWRVYLAADLDFLVPDLVEVGCEVYLMKSSSIGHNPGALWRFLAFEEEGRWVTVTDSDKGPIIFRDVERTETILKSGLGFWRLPYVLDPDTENEHPGYYRVASASHLGGIGGYQMSLLMKAFVWHAIRGSMPDHCTIGKGKGSSESFPIFGADWPNYGFDEWFLNAAMYPRMAFSGVATFCPLSGLPNRWLALDIEYVTWANQNSELIYYGESVLANQLRHNKKSKPARSPILNAMVDDAKSEVSHSTTPFPTIGSSQPLTLVVARYQEDLRWLLELPKDIRIAVYNKGKPLSDQKILDRVDYLEALPNVGREADTYLHHLQHFKHGAAEEWTAFCQGDPFPHSSSFIDLLRRRDIWQDVQPLTNMYMPESGTPPPILLTLQTSEWLGNIPVRTELCSAHTLGIVNWTDGGKWPVLKDYAEHHRVPVGWSLSGHFLEQCGLTELAAKAWKATLVRMAYAAVFAVRNERLDLLPKDLLPRMRRIACGHYSNGYMFERLWLHLFGMPFIEIDHVGQSDRRLETSQNTSL